MPAKFLVVECDDNNTALEMVRLMLEKGYVRLMLLDDLSKHPSLIQRSNVAESSVNLNNEPDRNKEEVAVNRALSAAKTVQEESEKEKRNIMEILQLSAPESKFFANVKEEASTEDLPKVSGSPDEVQNADFYADNEESSNNSLPFEVSASASARALDLLAQAHCLVGSGSSPDCNGPPTKKQRAGVTDPEKDYHTCRICGTRVKAPRGGRWNLQMHVMAMHSVKRPFQCPECEYTDYRKPGMRKHTILMHGQDLDPIDISTPEKRAEWDSVMGECFPEFAYRTGFLEQRQNLGVWPKVDSES